MTEDEGVCGDLSRGDIGAFEKVYRANFGRVRNFVSFYLHRSANVDDVVQETFLQLWKRPAGFDPSRSQLKAYLFGIARKKAADWGRHHPSPQALVTDVSGGSDSSEFLLSDALSRLEPEERNLLWLREVEGYSYDELAKMLKIPLGTVKSRLFAAREKLRKTWNCVERKERI